MNKALLRVILLATGLLTFVTFTSAQTLTSDLGQAFSRYDLAKIDKASKQISIAVEGKTHSITLVPHDMRAGNYKAEDTGFAGLQPVGRASAVDTFVGRVDGKASTSRFNMTARGLEGYFDTPTGRFFVEAANKFARDADADTYVVYRAENAVNTADLYCGQGLMEKIESGKTMVNANRTASMLRLELATEADVEYVNTLGGVAQANAEILGILNTVEGLYESELHLSIRVTYQHTWTVGGDPYAAANPQVAVQNFENYWNANFSYQQYPRDTAHLFSGKSNLLSQGWAWINIVCNRPDLAYGMSGYVDWAPAKYLITAHEIGHNLGANHSDNAPGCAGTLMSALLTGDTPMSFCQFSRDEIATHIATYNTCLTPGIACGFDFDGDAKADISVFRPATGAWFIARSNAGFLGVGFGQDGDKPVAADYDGDGRTDIAVYRAGTWFRLFSSTNTFDGVGFGNATDTPAPADFDGDGKADVAVFRASQGVWYQSLSANGAFNAYPFGAAGDVPLPADYDGDGKADINLFRPSNGGWYRVQSSTGGFVGIGFGTEGDKPVIGDFDGDGKTDIAVFRPSAGTWFVLRQDGSFYGTGFGSDGDVPTAADYDGDGKTDFAVFRPSQGVWYRLDSSTGAFVAYPFGLPTDKAVPSYYVP